MNTHTLQKQSFDKGSLGSSVWICQSLCPQDCLRVCCFGVGSVFDVFTTRPALRARVDPQICQCSRRRDSSLFFFRFVASVRFRFWTTEHSQDAGSVPSGRLPHSVAALGSDRSVLLQFAADSQCQFQALVDGVQA